MARAINRFSAHKKSRKRGGPIVAKALEGFTLLQEAIGLFGATPSEFQAEVKQKRLRSMGISLTEIEDALDRRVQARASKEWATSDAIRKELEDQGILVMDTQQGVEWRIKL